MTDAAPAVAQVAIALPQPSAADRIANMDAQLQSLLTSANVPEDTMALLADKRIVSVPLFANLADSRAEFRGFLRKVLKIDPDADDSHYVLVSELLVAYENAKAKTETLVKHNAERSVALLPPEVPAQDLQACRMAFEAT